MNTSRIALCGTRLANSKVSGIVLAGMLFVLFCPRAGQADSITESYTLLGVSEANFSASLTCESGIARASATGADTIFGTIDGLSVVAEHSTPVMVNKNYTMDAFFLAYKGGAPMIQFSVSGGTFSASYAQGSTAGSVQFQDNKTLIAPCNTPEPGTLVLAGIGSLAPILCFAWRRWAMQ